MPRSSLHSSFEILHSKFELRHSLASGTLLPTCTSAADHVQCLVDELLQLLPGLEVRDLLRWHFHLLAGLGVAAGPRFAAAETAAAESAQLDFLSGAERLHDGVEHDVHDGLGLFLRQLNDASYLVDQFGLGHHARLGVVRSVFRLFAQSVLLAGSCYHLYSHFAVGRLSTRCTIASVSSPLVRRSSNAG